MDTPQSTVGLFTAVNESTWEHIKIAPAVPYFAQYLACIGLFIFFGAYMTLTLDPLKIFLFKDPITDKYGFRAHTHLKNLKQKIRTKTKSKPKSRQKSNNSR